MLKNDRKAAVAGLGILGGSFARGLSEAGYEVTGIDIDHDALKYAEEHGWIARGSDDPSVISDCGIVISCLYPDTFISWLKQNQQYIAEGAFLTDVSGVKRSVIREVREILRDDIRYISVHPMAGRESRGIRYADNSLFLKANFIIVPDERNTQEDIRTAEKLAEDLKFARITQASPEQHDRAVAFLSQLPHVINACLMIVSDPDEARRFTGDSFRDMTRIARMNEDLWPQLYLKNRDDLLQEIDGFMAEMAEFRELLETGDTEKMKEKMRLSTRKRIEFDR